MEETNEIEVLKWQKKIVLERKKMVEENPDLIIDEIDFWKKFEDESEK